MVAKKTQVGNSKGNFTAVGLQDWENSTRIFQPKREKVTFNLATDVIKTLGDYEKYLQETNEYHESLQSGIVEEILFRTLGSHPKFQDWIKAKAKKNDSGRNQVSEVSEITDEDEEVDNALSSIGTNG